MARDGKESDVVARSPCANAEAFVAQHARDVSDEGIFLRTTSALPTGKLVDFEVQLSSAEVVLSGAGRIAWKREAPVGERPQGFAIKFVDLDEASRALVDQLVAARGGATSEYDMPPAAAPVKTVLGLGAANLGLGAGVTRPPEDKSARVGTRLGLAPPAIAAGLVLGEQSSPAVKPLPPPRGEATSDIDKGWLDEPVTGQRSAAPTAPVGGGGGEPPVTKTVALPVAAVAKPAEAAVATVALPVDAGLAAAAKAAAGRIEPAAKPSDERVAPVAKSAQALAEPVAQPAQARAAQRQESPRGESDPGDESADAAAEAPNPHPVSSAGEALAPALAAAAADRSPPRRAALWPWLVIFAIGVPLAGYRFRGPLHEAGVLPVIPAIPGVPDWLSGDETSAARDDEAATSTAAGTAPPPSSAPAAASVPAPASSAAHSAAVPSAAPSSAPPPAPFPAPPAASPRAPSASAATASAPPPAPKSPPDKPAASTKPAHAAASASAAPKSHPTPKTKPADENPY